jgi:ATP-binding protein involved in chromosome partitioning
MMLGVRKRSASRSAGVVLPLAEARMLSADRKLQPLMRYGVKIMSVGFFIGEEQAVAPMPDVLGLLIRQLLYSVDWGYLDYLLIDLPPGTSEPQATLCREMQVDSALLVTTPQDIARIDTAKALAMFQQAHVPVLGLVRNMAGFVCPHCAHTVEIFPQGEQVYSTLDGLPLLADIPLDPAAVVSGDRGHPAVVSMPDSLVTRAFIELAQQVASRVPGTFSPTDPAGDAERAVPEIFESEDQRKNEGEI